jgi:hypothetical protein
MAKKYPKVCELNETQRRHLAWRLDYKTWCGLITATRIAKGKQMEDLPLNEIFEVFNMNPRQAKIHATKVIKFNL